jgi:hypothetical protein
MLMSVRVLGALPILMTLPLVCGGCAEELEAGPTATANGGAARAPSPIKVIMGKLARGRGGVIPVLGMNLEQNPPPWEDMEPRARECVELAASLVQYDPPKGSKDSWSRLTSSYSGSAAALERAIQAKDLEASRKAQGELANGCMACHGAHR